MIKINEYSIVRDGKLFNVFRLDPSSGKIIPWMSSGSLFGAIQNITLNGYFHALYSFPL